MSGTAREPRCDDDDVGPPVARNEVTADQAADLLGVRLQTIYAYVSRGLLTRSHRTNESGHRVSVLALDEVLRLAAERTRVRTGSLEVLVETDVTLLDPKGDAVVPRARRRGARVAAVRGGCGARLGRPGRRWLGAAGPRRRHRPRGGIGPGRGGHRHRPGPCRGPGAGHRRPRPWRAQARPRRGRRPARDRGWGRRPRRRRWRLGRGPAVGSPSARRRVPTRGSPPSTPPSCC